MTDRYRREDDTQDNIAVDTDRITPVPPNPNVQRQPLPARRRGKARQRRESGLYLPLWSIALMLLVVAMITAGIVLLVVNLGGGDPTEQPAPVLIVNSPVPTVPGAVVASPATPTLPPQVDPGVSGAPPQPQNFVLQGPTLEAIATSTPTPPPIGVGVIVVVRDVEPEKLNIRNQAGTRDTEIIFRADEDTRLQILEGPVQSDGLTWWRIQETVGTGRSGWAASNYLEIATEQ